MRNANISLSSAMATETFSNRLSLSIIAPQESTFSSNKFQPQLADEKSQKTRSFSEVKTKPATSPTLPPHSASKNMSSFESMLTKPKRIEKIYSPAPTPLTFSVLPKLFSLAALKPRDKVKKLILLTLNSEILIVLDATWFVKKLQPPTAFTLSSINSFLVF